MDNFEGLTRICLKHICLLIFLLVVVQTIFGQDLLRNGGFEHYVDTPASKWDLEPCVDWSYLNSNIRKPIEYFHEDFNDQKYVGMKFDSVYYHSGKGMIYMAIFEDSAYKWKPRNRFYLTTPFRSGMEINKPYIISFWMANGSNQTVRKLSVNGIGIHLSTNKLKQHEYDPIIVESHTPTIASFSKNWTHYRFEVIADSAYTYMTFGTFLPDTEIVIVKHSKPTVNNDITASYYLDDFSILPGWLYVLGDSVICKGEYATLKALNDSDHNWALSSNRDSIIHRGETIRVNPQVTTEYIVTGKEDTASFTVFVNDIGAIDLGNDTTFCLGERLVLKGNSDQFEYNYNWDGINFTETHVVESEGVHWVVASKDGCTISDSIFISLKDCECLVSIPNSFSPNGDGLNDEFAPVFSCRLSKYHLSIINRWGDIVFETVDKTIGWPGDNKADSYVYHISYTTIGGDHFDKKGIIHAVAK